MFPRVITTYSLRNKNNWIICCSSSSNRRRRRSKNKMLCTRHKTTGNETKDKQWDCWTARFFLLLFCHFECMPFNKSCFEVTFECVQALIVPRKVFRYFVFFFISNATWVLFSFQLLAMNCQCAYTLLCISFILLVAQAAAV